MFSRTLHTCNLPFAKRKLLHNRDILKLIHFRYWHSHRQRQKQTQRTVLPSNDRHRLVILSSGGRMTPCVISLQSATGYYFFNYGEVANRIHDECRIGWKRKSEENHVFVTHCSWNNIGGIHNMFKKYSGDFETHPSASKITIHGPKKLEIFDVNHDRYQILKNIDNVDPEYRPLEKEFFEDSAFRIEYVQLVSDKSDVAVAYIVKPKESKKRHVLSLKCMQHNVIDRKYLNKLLNGESVTLDDGKVVTPDDILQAGGCVKPIIVIECPDTSFKNSLLNSEKIKKHRFLEGNVPDEDNVANLVLHITPEHVTNDEEYKKFMFSFGNRTRHLILNESTPSTIMKKNVLNHALFNATNEELFPVLALHKEYEESKREIYHLIFHTNGSLIEKDAKNYHQVSGQKQTMFSLKENNATTVQDYCKHKGSWWKEPNIDLGNLFETYNVIKGVPGLIITFRSEPVDFKYEGFKAETQDFSDNTTTNQIGKMKSYEIKSKLQALQQKVKELKNNLEGPKYPEVLFLGTSSQSATHYRNVSAYLLHIDEETVILLDCGADTIGQIFRFYGDQTPELLTKIKGIFISHAHTDHFIGMFGLLEERNRALEKINLNLPPVYIVGPKELSNWIKFYEETLEPLKNFEFWSFDKCRGTFTHFENYGIKRYEEIINHFRVKMFQPVRVPHMRNSHGIVIVDRNGKKIVYSGDTTPARSLMAAGENCDLLIHEATFADCHISDAISKKHSTISGAIEAGKKMKAKFTILTHFSKKYTFPLYDNKLTAKFGIGFDFLKVNVSNAKLLGLYNEFWKMLFEEQLEHTQKKHRGGDGVRIFLKQDINKDEYIDNKGKRNMLKRNYHSRITPTHPPDISDTNH